MNATNATPLWLKLGYIALMAPKRMAARSAARPDASRFRTLPTGPR